MLPGASNMLTAEGPHLRTQSSFTSIPHGTKHLPILQAMKFCAASLPSSGCSCSGRPTGDAYLSSSSTSRRAELRKPPVCLLAPQLVRCDASRSSAATCRVATLSQASIDGVPLEEEASPGPDQRIPLREQLEQRYGDAAAQPRDQQSSADAQKAAAAEIGAASGLAPHEGRLVWDAVSKPLIRVGRGGVQRSHLQSLGELLQAHTLVKVQLNSANADIASVGLQLADGTGGSLLWAKGRTLLLGAPGAGTGHLLDIADASARRSAASNDRKAALTAAGAPSSQLSPVVSAKLRSLVSGNVVGEAELDNHSIRCLAALPERVGLGVLDGCTKAKLRGVRNKSAWLTSQCRRLSKQTRTPPG